MYLLCNLLVLLGIYILVFMYVVIKCEVCFSIWFIVFDIEILSLIILNERFIYIGYIIFYIKYNEND